VGLDLVKVKHEVKGGHLDVCQEKGGSAGVVKGGSWNGVKGGSLGLVRGGSLGVVKRGPWDVVKGGALYTGMW
jgi:hypothetical protein